MNKKILKIEKATDFQDLLKRELKNPEFRKLYDEYGRQFEISYAILQLRKKKKMSQAQLAKRIGTKQSNIARMEAGQQNFTIETLDKIATAMNCKLDIKFC